MKSKEPAKSRKQAVIVKDLDARKNPKGGAPCTSKIGTLKIQPTDDCNSALQGVSTTR